MCAGEWSVRRLLGTSEVVVCLNRDRPKKKMSFEAAR